MNATDNKTNARQFMGNIPKDSHLYSSWGEWALYDCGKREQWNNLKVIRLRADADKANFYLAFNMSECKFVRNRDFRLLKEHHTDIYGLVVAFMQKRFLVA